MNRHDSTRRVPVPILTYHNIGAPPPGATHRGLWLSTDKFRAQMDWLRRRGWRGVSMDEGIHHLRGERRGRVAVLTFDDGYVDNLELALPVLREFGFGATCYLVAEQIGGYNAWDHEELRVRKPLMDRAQIGQWLAAGMGVGSHTLSHPHLPQLPRTQKRREIVDSRARLQDALGVAIDHFCFPYGDHDAECVEDVAHAGYASAVTTRKGCAGPGRDLRTLPRLGNNGRRSLLRFQLRSLGWEW